MFILDKIKNKLKKKQEPVSVCYDCVKVYDCPYGDRGKSECWYKVPMEEKEE